MSSHGPSVKSEAYTQDDLMRSQESPPTIGTLVKNHLDEMASGIHTAHTSRREMFSYKRLEPALCFTPASFNDGKVFSRWLEEAFFPRMTHLRVERGLALESLRENCGHLATWMGEHGVSPLIVRQFKVYISQKRGQLWKQLVKAGAPAHDEKPLLTPEDVAKLLKFTDRMLKNPKLLQSSNMKYRKKPGEKKARYRRATKRIALNLHAALRMGILATKRPNEIMAIKRNEIDQHRVILRPSKTYRNGETTVYEMWPEYWPSFKALLDSHEGDGLFSLNPVTLSNWFKSLMVALGFEHHWFNLHRLRSFSGDALAMSGANELEMMAHGDWASSDSVQAYIGEQGRRANLASASKKKHAFAKKAGLATTPKETEADIVMSLILDMNASVHDNPPGQWMSLTHTEETVGEFMNRTSGGSLLNLEDMDETSFVQGDEFGLLSSKVVDVPRFELGASTMPR
jgi:integrase